MRQLGAVDHRIEYSNRGGGSGGAASVSIGTYANLPASGTTSGEMYICTDTPLEFIWNGSSWLAFWGTQPVTLPLSTGWAWSNQDNATIDTTKGVFTMVTAASGNQDIQLYERDVPSTPYTVTIGLMPSYAGIRHTRHGVIFRESATGKHIGILRSWNSQDYIAVIKSNDDSWTGAANYIQYTWESFSPFYLQWFRLADDGTNLTFSMSIDGMNFFTLYGPVSKTDFFTTAPDKVGFFLDHYRMTDTGESGIATLVSWVEA